MKKVDIDLMPCDKAHRRGVFKGANFMKRTSVFVVFSFLAITFATEVFAATTIGVNFQGRASGCIDRTGFCDPTGPLAPTEVAGVVPQPHWNNVADSTFTPAENGTTGPLVDSNGAPTTVTLTFAANDSWNNDTDPTTITTGNARMMNGIIKMQGAGASSQFTFNNVPEGSYDLYVYFNKNADGAQMDLTDHSNLTTYYVTETHQFTDSSSFVQVTSTTASARQVGNYAKFSNLGTFGTLSLGLSAKYVTGGDGGNGISGLQLIHVGGPLVKQPPSTAQGAITVREFRPTTDQIATLTNLASFPNSPDVVDYSPRFEWPTGPDDATPPPTDSGKNNYGVQILGYFYPPETADYIFAINSDDNGLLYLSTDATPANKRLIASEPMWSNVRQFASTAQRTLVDIGTADERFINVSKKIHLTNGVPVYIEALMSEGTGGDNLSVAFSTNGSPPQSGDQPIPGVYLRSIDRADGPVAFQTVPASQTIQAGGSVTFRVAVSSGTPPYTYQWLRDGVEIPGETSSAYSIPRVGASDNGARFVVQVSNPAGSTNTPPATLTVTADIGAPAITKVTGSDGFDAATVKYSEPVNDAAADFTNYKLSGGVAVTAAEFVVFDPNDTSAPTNRTTVHLTTSKQPDGAQLTLTVSNVKDLPGNALAPNTATLYTFTFKSGILSHKIWLGQGTSIDTLTNNAAAYNNPSIVDTRNNAEQGLNNAQNEGVPSQNYLSNLQGFFIPAVTTNYVFFFCADNDGYMYLSTDETPANKKLIAADVGWQNVRTWTGPGGDTVKRRGDLMGGGPFENRSDELLTSPRVLNGVGALNGFLPADGVDPDPWPTTDADGNAVITLTAGKRYYMELWHVEFEGGAVQATMKIAGTPDPANGTASTLTGNLIGAIVDPSALAPVITNQPVGVDFNPGDTLRLSVGADSALPLTYQWYRALAAISGATNSTLTITNAGLGAAGPYYVAVSNLNGSVNSQSVLAFTALAPPQRRTFQQDATGLVVIEAENYYDATRAADGHVWFPQTARPGYSGTGYLQALPDSGANQGAYPALLTVSPRLDFKVNFTQTGTNYVWLRGGAPLADGAGDSVHAGLDGDNPASARRIDGTPTFNIATGWNWVGNIQGDTRAFIVVTNAGEHTFNIWMREDGFNLDRILLTTDAAYTPANPGPPESSSVIAGGRPTISLSRNAGGTPVITYTGTLESSSKVDGPYTAVGGASGGTFTPDVQQAVQQFYRAKQ